MVFLLLSCSVGAVHQKLAGGAAARGAIPGAAGEDPEADPQEQVHPLQANRNLRHQHRTADPQQHQLAGHRAVHQRARVPLQAQGRDREDHRRSLPAVGHLRYPLPYPVDALNKSLEQFQHEEEVLHLIKQQERDYQISLTGKLPSFNVSVPESFTAQKFVEVQNQITKSSPALIQRPTSSKWGSSRSWLSTRRKSWRGTLSCWPSWEARRRSRRRS